MRPFSCTGWANGEHGAGKMICDEVERYEYKDAWGIPRNVDISFMPFA
jgi:hypothetical protein